MSAKCRKADVGLHTITYRGSGVPLGEPFVSLQTHGLRRSAKDQAPETVAVYSVSLFSHGHVRPRRPADDLCRDLG